MTVHAQTFGINLSDKTRDQVLISLWFFVTFKPFNNDELILYPLALYFAWAFVRDFNLILPILLRSLIVFAFPLWFVLSVMWGAEQALILRTGAQMFLTVLICYAAIVRLEPRDLILPILLTSTWYGLQSFLVVLTGEGLATRGVFKSKNAMGMAMVILWTAALCTLLDRERPHWLRLAATAAACLALFQIFVANSATAVLLAVGILGAILVFGILPRFGAFRSPTFLGALCMLLAGVFFASAGFFAYNSADPVGAVLGAFGKDTTLTGRTELWHYAEVQIKEAPYLGVGAGGFWTPWDGLSTARVIYDQFYKAYYATFSFHNSYYEIAVHQGLIGMAIAIITVLWLSWRLLLDAFLNNSIPTAFFVCIGLVTLALSMTEAMLFSAFNLYSMLFMMGVFLSIKNSPALRAHVQSYS
ncbi:MAG: O-antigen ligase family protein [Pseudomonadota bacterium]